MFRCEHGEATVHERTVAYLSKPAVRSQGLIYTMTFTKYITITLILSSSFFMSQVPLYIFNKAQHHFNEIHLFSCITFVSLLVTSSFIVYYLTFYSIYMYKLLMLQIWCMKSWFTCSNFYNCVHIYQVPQWFNLYLD